jgi:hypothetical protein
MRVRLCELETYGCVLSVYILRMLYVRLKTYCWLLFSLVIRNLGESGFFPGIFGFSGDFRFGPETSDF